MKNKPVNWKVIDPLLYDAYRNRRRGRITAISEEFGVWRATLCKRAVKIGARKHGQRSFNFSEAESNFMIKHYLTPLPELQKLMEEKRFPKRSRESLYDHFALLREKGLLLSRSDEFSERDCYKVEEVCELLGVGEASVRRWIHQKILVCAYLADTSSQSYGFPIKRKDLHEFMKNNPSKWDSHKCDHLWMVDILTSPEFDGKMEMVRQDFAGVDERKIPYSKT